MMKRLVEEKNMQISKRLTAILLAVVFVFGMMYMPTGIYAVETDATDDSTVAADEENTGTTEVTEETVEEETSGEATETDAEVSEETPAEENSIDALTEAITVDLDSLDESEYDGFIYKVTDDTTKQEIKEMEKAVDDLDKGQEVEEVVNNEIYTADSIETIAEVAPPEQIEYIEPDYIVHAMEAEPNDTYYENYGWYLRMINAPYVWEKEMFGDDTVVAVLDSGVNLDHPDYETIHFTKPFNALEKSEDVTDDYGHGTKVTGVIAASYNNGKGLSGVMPGTTVMPVKVLNASGASTSSVIITGIDYAISKDADIINMSFGGSFGGSASITLENKCKEAAAAGIILVAAAGNDAENGNPVMYPAAYSCVVSVASVDADERHSYFSTYNKYVSVAAPGERLALTRNNGGYVLDSGTSFAAPQVSAMAAMIKEMDPFVNCAGFMKIIAATSADKGAKGYDVYYGYGLMDLKKAYNYMAGDIAMYEASLSSSSYTYNGGTKTPSVTVRKANRAVSTNYYKATYPAGRKAVGTYKITVEGINGYVGTKVLSFKIVPPLVKSIRAPLRQKGKLTVRWYAMSTSQKNKYKNGITGYQVRVSTSSKFTNAKYVKVKGYTKTKVAVKGLKKKTTYYVQYRAYKTVGSATYYSKWSGKKKARTK